MPEKHDKPETLGALGYTEDFSLFGQYAADDPEPPVARRLFGKYRGTVLENDDPYEQGRLLVSVPGITVGNWAMPCVAVTDIEMGTFTRPRVGANVWIEFERGDPDKPIWVGCYWGPGETPTLAKAAVSVPPTNTVITIETATSGIAISDVPLLGANILIQSAIGMIMLTPAGIQITAPTVEIVADTSFTVAAPNFTVV